MGILDEAIKEHLELKRAHGAAESELKQLEDEAFGAAERPGEAPPADAAAEAPTQFMEQPKVEEKEGGQRSRRPDIADLQEPPPPPPAESAPPPEATQAEPEAPAEESAKEHEAVAEIGTGPTTEEREAIAEQPTEMYDVEEELSSSQAEAPSEEDLVEEGMEEPRVTAVDADEEYEEDDDFWDEKRLSDELDQALEAPSDAEDEEALFEDAATEAEEPVEEGSPDEPHPERVRSADDDEDVLEETPDFLEETPEDDQLWFEQKPPKDFDFDD
jgi:hypothetical protein